MLCVTGACMGLCGYEMGALSVSYIKGGPRGLLVHLNDHARMITCMQCSRSRIG